MARIVAYRLVPFLSLVVTFVTGYLGSYNQGLPLAWRNVIACPGPGEEFVCYLQSGANWIVFALDALFFAIIGYGLLTGYSIFRARRTKRPILKTLSERFHNRLSIPAGIFRSRSKRVKGAIGLLIGILVLLFFFLAPVVPGETVATYYPSPTAGNPNCWPCGSCFVMHEYWSDWRAPGYALVGIGYHTPKIFEFAKSDVCF